ncbi:MAG: pyruvate formate-lyase activating enzyme [Deltaproteobacteria bacterium]|nr:pyruvate formate-lyase activating enzyme [Deltaproteobacteria bacterium]
MARILTIDVGAGTMDILWVDTEKKLLYKLVAKSPTMFLAEKILSSQKDIVITGVEMGGGAIANAIKEKAKEKKVVITKSAAFTIHSDLSRVKSYGVRIVDDNENLKELNKKEWDYFETKDIDPERIYAILETIGVEPFVDIIGVAVQDHGRPPKGLSAIDFRHEIFKKSLSNNPYPWTFIFNDNEIPAYLTRMKAVVKSVKKLNPSSIYIMDTGMAAITGAYLDDLSMVKDIVVVLDIATSHTLGATLIKGEVAGFFEYHTKGINSSIISSYVKALADGKLIHKKVVEEGGHGAFIRKLVGFENVEAIIATGPKRDIIKDIDLKIHFGSPIGDNMMTGAVGLLFAIGKKEKLNLSFLFSD